MKTRIEIIEYNNGQIKFACQEDTFKIHSLKSAGWIWGYFIFMMASLFYLDCPLLGFVIVIVLVIIAFVIRDKNVVWETIEVNYPLA